MSARVSWVVAAALFAAVGCRPKPKPAPDAKVVLGEVGPRDDVDFVPYLATARAILTKVARPEAPPARPGQRVFVTVWSGGEPTVGTGMGATLLASVAAAAESITAPPGEIRVQIDLPRTSEPATVLPGSIELPLGDVGVRGYVATNGDRVGTILPTEIIAHRYYDTETLAQGKIKLTRDRVASLLTMRAGLEGRAIDEAPLYPVTTTSVIESKAGSPRRAIRLVRGMPPRPDVMTPDEMREAARNGAAYLARVLDGKGRFAYVVRPDDSPEELYSSLRHAGATYAMLESYAESSDPAILQKAESALENLELALRGTQWGAYAGDNVANEEQQKAGGAGLALLTFAKHKELTGKKQFDAAMKALSTFILHQQYPDGHFRANADVEREDPAAKAKNLKPEVTYYAGEATLGLLRYNLVAPDPVLVSSAKKAIDYIVKVRDAGQDEDHLTHDHWLSYAILEHYRATKDPQYAEHAFKIARAILKAEVKEKAPAPDFVGSFYVLGDATPAATRLEALGAIAQLSREIGKDTAWLDAALTRIACFVRGHQLDADNTYFYKKPARVIGGVRGGLFSHEIRIDYVQHAASGWLHLASLRGGASGPPKDSGAKP